MSLVGLFVVLFLDACLCVCVFGDDEEHAAGSSRTAAAGWFGTRHSGCCIRGRDGKMKKRLAG